MKQRKEKTKKRQVKERKFLDFLKQKDNKRDFLILALVNIVIYALLVNLYPYMDVTTDTDTYLLSAKSGTISGYRPYGYSWFIGLVYGISTSFRALFIAQFLVNFIAQLFLLFTVKYLFKLSKPAFYTLSALLVLAPSIIYCINYMMSECLFTSLTFIFIATCLWLLNKPSIWIFIVHIFVMAFAIYIRYTALFYPLFSAVLLIYQYRKKGAYKLIAVLPLVVMFIIYNNIKKEYKQEIGIDTFSGFSGWALANNAVSVIPYIDLKKEEIEDSELQLLHEICTYYPDSIYSHQMINSTSFMWEKELAGKQFFFKIMQNKDMAYVPGWAYASIKLKDYAVMLIKKYPGLYFKHFLWPNFLQTFKYYPLPEPTVFKPQKGVTSYYGVDVEEYKFKSNVYGGINKVRKITDPLLWVLFFAAAIIYFVKNKWLNLSVNERHFINVLLIFGVMFVAFCVVTHPINNFRYLIPVYFIKVFLPVIVIFRIIDNRKKEEINVT